MRKTLTSEIAKTIGKLVSLEESKTHLGGDNNQPTREEASRTGLGQLALAMNPTFEDNVNEDDTPENTLHTYRAGSDHISVCGSCHNNQSVTKKLNRQNATRVMRSEMSSDKVKNDCDNCNGKLRNYTETVTEDTMGDATSGLQRDVALAMNKSGLPTPLGAPDPSEQNPAFMGNPALNATVAHYQPGPPSYQDGMVKPQDRRGTSADQSGLAMGTAPDGPDISTISDPLLRKIFSESFKHYTEGLMWLVSATNKDLAEAEKVLAMEFPLDDTYKQAMIRRIKESDGSNGWPEIKESLQESTGVNARPTKRQFQEGKTCTTCKGRKCNGKGCRKATDESVGQMIGAWFANSPKK